MMKRSVLVCALVALASSPLSAQQVPAVPSTVAVAPNAKETAVLVLDVASSPCGRIPQCTALVPRIASLLAAARTAGVAVVFSSAEPNAITAPVSQPSFLPAVAPHAGDTVFTGGAQDRFYGTLLDQWLRKRGITTLVLSGWRENGSLLYTAVAANLRGYTVVVADDATSAAQDYDVAIGRYQLLTQLNANPKNEPLRKGAVTLSRTDLITFRR
jgi:nicotinamidase-related amidase